MPTFYRTTDTAPEPVSRLKGSHPEGIFDVSAEQMPTGWSTRAQMVAASPLSYVAHRGGSENWPEMTLRAYTNSVAWGANALEVSVARTTDNVYFGLHDQYLDRTSLNDPDGTTLNPALMTWEQVQAYDVFGVQPYMRLEELTEAYGSSHVLFIDPKFINRSNATSRNHFLNTVKALVPSWSTSVVIKLFWGFNSDWGAAAKAAGFHTWGYLWEEDGFPEISSNPANHSNFDWLGMNYDATAGTWTTMVGLGKPLLGHVCPDQSAVDAAISKGAFGAMVSGVRQVIPPKIAWPY